MTWSRCSQDDALCGSGAALSRRGNRHAARELVSPVMTRGSCRVYRIKQQTNQVATMGLMSQAAAASDTDVEFSSELLQTVSSSARWRNIRGSGVGHVPPSRAGSLRQIFANNNRHPLAGSTTKKRGATVARMGRSKWRHRFAICLALVERHHPLLTRSLSYVSLRYLPGIYVATGASSRSPSPMDGVRRGTKEPRYALKEMFGFPTPDGSNSSIVAEGYRHYLLRIITQDILYPINRSQLVFIRHEDAVESNKSLNRKSL